MNKVVCLWPKADVNSMCSGAGILTDQPKCGKMRDVGVGKVAFVRSTLKVRVNDESRVDLKI